MSGIQYCNYIKKCIISLVCCDDCDDDSTSCTTSNDVNDDKHIRNSACDGDCNVNSRNDINRKNTIKVDTYSTDIEIPNITVLQLMTDQNNGQQQSSDLTEESLRLHNLAYSTNMPNKESVLQQDNTLEKLNYTASDQQSVYTKIYNNNEATLLMPNIHIIDPYYDDKSIAIDMGELDVKTDTDEFTAPLDNINITTTNITTTNITTPDNTTTNITTPDNTTPDNIANDITIPGNIANDITTPGNIANNKQINDQINQSTDNHIDMLASITSNGETWIVCKK